MCRKRQIKFQGPIPKYSYGSCAKIWLSMHVNTNVNGIIKTPQGNEVKIDEITRNQVRAKWQEMQGKPFRVVVSRDLKCDFCLLCCPLCAIFCNDCKFECGCPDPLNLQWASVDELWFAEKSDESACEGASTHCFSWCTCGLPIWWSSNCVETMHIYEEQIGLELVGESREYVMDLGANFHSIKLNIPLHKLAPARQLMESAKVIEMPIQQYPNQQMNLSYGNQSGYNQQLSPLPPQYS
jgi:hypothetical protein